MEYFAFISYRHADNVNLGRQWATWLHQALESYEVPEELVGKINNRGTETPTRIFPIFRDEDALPAVGDLKNSVSRALDNSYLLIVLCSPNAAVSKYVAEEIDHFKRLGRSERIIAAIIDGEPNASWDVLKHGKNINSDAECFPAPLLTKYDESGNPTEIRAEPLAADFRVNIAGNLRQGFTSPEALKQHLNREWILSGQEIQKCIKAYEKKLELMKLKIIAGVLALPLDELTQRDKAFQLHKAKLRVKRMAILAAGFGLLSIIAIVAGWKAYENQQEATEQRILAEQNLSLIEQERDRVKVENSIAKSRELAAQSFLELETNQAQALALALHAYHTNPTELSKQALIQALNNDVRKAIHAHDSDIIAIAVSPDGQFVATGSKNADISIWKRDSFKLVFTDSLPELSGAEGILDEINEFRWGDKSTFYYSGNAYFDQLYEVKLHIPREGIPESTEIQVTVNTFQSENSSSDTFKNWWRFLDASYSAVLGGLLIEKNRNYIVAKDGRLVWEDDQSFDEILIDDSGQFLTTLSNRWLNIIDLKNIHREIKSNLVDCPLRLSNNYDVNTYSYSPDSKYFSWLSETGKVCLLELEGEVYSLKPSESKLSMELRFSESSQYLTTGHSSCEFGECSFAILDIFDVSQKHNITNKRQHLDETFVFYNSAANNSRINTILEPHEQRIRNKNMYASVSESLIYLHTDSSIASKLGMVTHFGMHEFPIKATISENYFVGITCNSARRFEWGENCNGHRLSLHKIPSSLQLKEIDKSDEDYWIASELTTGYIANMGTPERSYITPDQLHLLVYDGLKFFVIKLPTLEVERIINMNDVKQISFDLQANYSFLMLDSNNNLKRRYFDISTNVIEEACARLARFYESQETKKNMRSQDCVE